MMNDRMSARASASKISKSTFRCKAESGSESMESKGGFASGLAPKSE